MSYGINGILEFGDRSIFAELYCAQLLLFDY
ncbi:hypothetical protein ES705_04692 [subsurface metagenome]